MFLISAPLLLFQISNFINGFRYDYENCDSASADKMMQSIEALIQKPEFIGKKLQYEGKEYVVKQADNYSYTDPVDGSKATKQVCSMIIVKFHKFSSYSYIILNLYFVIGFTNFVRGWFPDNIPLIWNGKFRRYYPYVYR